MYKLYQCVVPRLLACAIREHILIWSKTSDGLALAVNQMVPITAACH